MKKATLLTAFLALLALPALTLGETWASFAARAGEALAAAKQNQVVTIEAEAVACYRYTLDPDNGNILPLDPALSVPYLKRLIIKGGSFDGMLVERGDGMLQLDGVTVRSTEAGRPAIQLLDGGEDDFLLLEIGEDTLVEATGEKAPAIGNMIQAAVTYPDRGMAVVILNHGSLLSADAVDGGAVALHYGNSGQDPVTLTVQNFGKMQAPVRLDAYSRGKALVGLTNEAGGVISGPAFYLWLEAYSQLAGADTTFYNKGTIRAQEPRRGGRGEPAGHIYLAANWSDYGLGASGPEAQGEIFLGNPGKMTEEMQVEFWTPLSPETTLVWQAEDQGESFPGSVFVTLERDTRAGEPEEAALLQEAKDWLARRQHRFPALPKDTPLRMRMVLNGGEAGWKYYPETPWSDTWAGWGLPTKD